MEIELRYDSQRGGYSLEFPHPMDRSKNAEFLFIPDGLHGALEKELNELEKYQTARLRNGVKALYPPKDVVARFIARHAEALHYQFERVKQNYMEAAEADKALA